jgi:hypothetical protein
VVHLKERLCFIYRRGCGSLVGEVVVQWQERV